MQKSRTVTLVLCAFFAALSAVLSQFSIYIGPVPINLTHVSVFLGAGLLGHKYGAVSQLVFVLMGAVGIPVFSGAAGGLGVLLGPTGGFIAGYVACAWVVGWLVHRWGSGIKTLIPILYAGWAVTYSCGVAWFMFITQTSLAGALSICVLPFLPGDLLKTVVSAVLINRISCYNYVTLLNK